MRKLRRSICCITDAVYRTRPLVIQLECPNIIRIREKGRRLWYETTVESLFSMAAKQYAMRAREEKKKEKEAKKNGFS